MELPHIGQTCVICRRDDYLPFKCKYCNKIVCVDHKADHGIECPLNSSQFKKFESSPSSEGLKRSCDYCSKITLKLELVECNHCRGQHCLYHRHQVQHDCRDLKEKQELAKQENDVKIDRRREALEKLKQSYQTSSILPTQSKYIQEHQDPKKRALAKKIRLMKIRQTAKGPPNILQEDKMYFQIKFIHEPRSTLSEASKDGKDVKVFTTNRHTIGRMIDFAAEQLSLTNKNNIKDASQLVLKKQIASNETVDLDSQKLFSHYMENEILETGDEILLTYTTE